MPFSHPFNRPFILDLVSQCRCNHALDIGIGYGAIGAYLKYNLPHIILDGIEIYEDYKYHTLAQWNVYRNIWIGDFTQMLIPPIYDAILAIDVIEHLEKQEGTNQILRLSSLVQKVFILSIPLGEYPQGAYEGNLYETHKATWYESELRNLGLSLVAQNDVIGVFATRRR